MIKTAHDSIFNISCLAVLLMRDNSIFFILSIGIDSHSCVSKCFSSFLHYSNTVSGFPSYFGVVLMKSNILFLYPAEAQLFSTQVYSLVYLFPLSLPLAIACKYSCVSSVNLDCSSIAFTLTIG